MASSLVDPINALKTRLPSYKAIYRKAVIHPAPRWLAVILWMGVIFALSAMPSLASPLEPFHDFILRKLAHMAEYAVLTGLLFRALRIHIARKTQVLLIAVLVAILYAFSDEWHQTFVPGREGSLRDIGIDALGIAGVSVWLRSMRSLGGE
jgi:VanZ family protein